MYFCTKNKVAVVVVVVVVIVVKRTGAGRCTGFEGGGGEERARGESSKRVGSAGA